MFMQCNEGFGLANKGTKCLPCLKDHCTRCEEDYAHCEECQTGFTTISKNGSCVPCSDKKCQNCDGDEPSKCNKVSKSVHLPRIEAK